MSDFIIYSLVGLFVVLGLRLTFPTWFYYKGQWAKRQFWLALGRCPRCRESVNYDRNGRQICPNCGRPC